MIRAAINNDRPPLGFAELVALTAALMALNALAIDMMLPALGIIGEELGAPADNDRQLIIVAYIVGNGAAQLVFGPIVDRFGRRRVVLWALAAYAVCSGLSIIAGGFSMMLAARAFQGVSTAATRVVSVAIVRDLTAGRRMAEVMSVAITVFMAAPILAPGIGQLILFAAPWRGIFVVLLLYGLVLMAWIYFRVPETLAVKDRIPLDASRILASYGAFLADRTSFGYTLASAFCFAGLFAYISASEQIFLETFELGAKFPIAFALVAAALGAATLLNARIVKRFGMRRLSHCALIVFVIASIIHLAIVYSGFESFAVFMFFMMVSFFCLGLIGANMSAIAMEPMGHIAGAAAAANGFAGTTIAGMFGGLVARQYDGTTAPIVAGFAVLGALALATVLWTEKGRLFGAHGDALAAGEATD